VTLPGLPTSSDRSADIGVVVEPRREVVEVRTDDERAVYVVEPVVAATSIVPTVLADLSDVDSTPPADGQVLTFSTGIAKWAPATASTEDLDARVTALEARPVVDSPDDIGAAPAGDYATDAELATGLAGKADTGHSHPGPAPVALADSATIVTDTALGSHFRVTLGGNRTLGVPANPVDGRKVLWELVQDGTGSRVLTLASGAGGFMVGADGPVVLSTATGARDFLGAIYSSALDRWLVLALAKGF
jgi:hypothetical protein